jgi:serine/threonine-protein kinase
MPDAHDPRAAVAQKRLGTVLKEKWRLDELLGVGGMAAVYAATHRNGKRVAVKMLHKEYAADAEVKARFLREGYLVNRVEHPGVVGVLDDDGSDGAAFLVMELLEGESLEQRRQRKGGKLPATHAVEMVHRDLKPENLFLCKDGSVKLLDFGIARLRELSARLGATQSGGTTMGTPAFMPHEQARGNWESVDARTDIWALGATLFTLLTGQIVHDAPSVTDLLMCAMTKQPAPLATRLPGAPESLSLVIDRALRFEQSERWPDARSMQAEVRRVYNELAGRGRVQAAPPALDVTGRVSADVVKKAREEAQRRLQASQPAVAAMNLLGQQPPPAQPGAREAPAQPRPRVEPASPQLQRAPQQAPEPAGRAQSAPAAPRPAPPRPASAAPPRPQPPRAAAPLPIPQPPPSPMPSSKQQPPMTDAPAAGVSAAFTPTAVSGAPLPPQPQAQLGQAPSPAPQQPRLAPMQAHMAQPAPMQSADASRAPFAAPVPSAGPANTPRMTPPPPAPIAPQQQPQPQQAKPQPIGQHPMAMAQQGMAQPQQGMAPQHALAQQAHLAARPPMQPPQAHAAPVVAPLGPPDALATLAMQRPRPALDPALPFSGARTPAPRTPLRALLLLGAGAAVALLLGVVGILVFDHRGARDAPDAGAAASSASASATAAPAK